MKIKLFREFNSFSNICIKCGEEYWGTDDCCEDCKDFDLEDEEIEKIIRTEDSKSLPFFHVPTTKSQNIYNL